MSFWQVHNTPHGKSLQFPRISPSHRASIGLRRGRARAVARNATGKNRQRLEAYLKFSVRKETQPWR